MSITARYRHGSLHLRLRGGHAQAVLGLLAELIQRLDAPEGPRSHCESVQNRFGTVQDQFLFLAGTSGGDGQKNGSEG